MFSVAYYQCLLRVESEKLKIKQQQTLIINSGSKITSNSNYKI